AQRPLRHRPGGNPGARVARGRPRDVVPDPVSWMLIERGWPVVDADGRELGRVDEVLGDEDADIFNGLQILAGTLGTPTYVPAERVGDRRGPRPAAAYERRVRLGRRDRKAHRRLGRLGELAGELRADGVLAQAADRGGERGGGRAGERARLHRAPVAEQGDRD